MEDLAVGGEGPEVAGFLLNFHGVDCLVAGDPQVFQVAVVYYGRSKSSQLGRLAQKVFRLLTWAVFTFELNAVALMVFLEYRLLLEDVFRRAAVYQVSRLLHQFLALHVNPLVVSVRVGGVVRRDFVRANFNHPSRWLELARLSKGKVPKLFEARVAANLGWIQNLYSEEIGRHVVKARAEHFKVSRNKRVSELVVLDVEQPQVSQVLEAVQAR